MRIEASQQLRLEQQVRLAPRIIQAMEILQLPMMALQERIDSELESNPVLEMREAEADESAPPEGAEDRPEERGEQPMVVDGGNGHENDFKRLADFEDEFGPEFIQPDAPFRPARARRRAGPEDGGDGQRPGPRRVAERAPAEPVGRSWRPTRTSRPPGG